MMRSGRLLAALAVVLTVLGTGWQSSQASCMGITTEEQIGMADVIAEGKVARVDQPRSGGTYTTITITRLYKGEPPNPLLIYSRSDKNSFTSVDYEMNPGEEHTLFLKAAEEKGLKVYTTDICTGSHKGSLLAMEKKLLGAGQDPPRAGSPPRVPGMAVGDTSQFWIPWVAVGVTAAALLVAIYGSRLIKKKR